ncbi:hypothetical protein BDC45DRAFT_585897 [Circinella umbellata]|nr:hypothetical protein BDC45DRAFT_585897 [Circinella umbellata]
MNIPPYESFSYNYGDFENISFSTEESGTRTTQSDATMLVTNRSSGAIPMSLISTTQQQKETRVNNTSNVSNVYCLYNANATSSLSQGSNYEWNQQHGPQLSSDFCPPVNRDYCDINILNGNTNNSHVWGQEQSINLATSNDKGLSSGPHKRTLSVPEGNRFGQKYFLTRSTTETINPKWPSYSNSRASRNYTNDNIPHQQQQLTIDTSFLSTEPSDEWKLLQQHDWMQQIENHNNNQRFSSSSSSASKKMNQQLCYSFDDNYVDYPLLSSSGESSNESSVLQQLQQWTTIENSSYPSSSRTSSLQQRPAKEPQCNPFSLLSAGCVNTRIDSSNSTNSNTDSNRCFSGESSRLSSISSSSSSVSSTRTTAKKDSYICFFGTCRQKIGRRSDLPRHIRSKHDQVNEKVQYQCHGCCKYITCARRDMINRHINNTCSNIKKKKVISSRQPHSPVSADKDNSMNINNYGYTIIKKPSVYRCLFDKCDETFPDEPDYENHILDHDTINKKIDITDYCDSCGEVKYYTRIQHLKRHFEECHTK